MRLINADELRFEIEKYFAGLPIQGHYDMLKMVDEAPTIEAEPVKYGRWETEIITDELGCKHAYYACSLCGKVSDDEYTYCPNCGAKMENGEEA